MKVSKRRFLLFLYFVSAQECGSRLTEPVGFIQSPNYPTPYPNNFQCSWIIGASPTDTVTISAEGFNVEPAQGCLFDYVELQTSTFTERYCGRTSRNFGENRSGQLTTTGSVQIVFQSDAGDAYLGFRLRYEITSGETLGVGDDDFSCQCVPGFVGPFCETNEDNCRINLCENGGQCIDRLNNFDCICPAGFSGPRCQTIRDPCQPNPCRNGGACESRQLEFTCFCLGWEGFLCDQPISEESEDTSSSISSSFSNETSQNTTNNNSSSGFSKSVIVYGAAGGGGIIVLGAIAAAAYFWKKKKTSSKNWVQPVNTLPKTIIEDVEAPPVADAELKRGVNLLTSKTTTHAKTSMPRSTIDFGQFSEHL
ncbi:Oidioi.mRNA.OKI2018_I69.XSR.g16615.t1.cds [Oikopleura dioica]|uniref:Oidioi.mRNA.OKI2018_I69.XSR.g16615.t1.cds n=1 Tax=Oikopleura dioica TaxID=34765 RepID=A0ABN7SGP1_OIKDI|nr:Oidioi.mRNA.OKI2018_I69.XSR.g16615.t1.cds [Oikopleura dioica]